MSYLIGALSFVCVGVLAYGVCVFTSLEPDVFKWSEPGRFFFATYSIVLGAIATAFALGWMRRRKERRPK